MSEITNTATIRVVADASGVEAGLRQVTDAARQAGRSVSDVGAGAANSTRNIEAAQRNIISAIQRTTLAMESGGKATAAYYEALANQRGIESSVLAPYITQLRAVEEAQARTTQAATAQAAAQQAAQQQATEAARQQAAAERELAQAQANRDSFVSGLREQIALFGASTEEVQRYRAAQLGAARDAEPLIAQLQALRVAQEQAAAAAQLMERAQREAAQINTSRDTFLSSLREEIALFGRSAEEVQLYRAAQLNAANAAAPLIAQLRDLREAEERAAAGARVMEQAQREALQMNTSRDALLSGLREQIALFGRSADEVLQYRAAQVGATAAAGALVTQLRALREAQEQANQAQREQAGRDSFVTNLREQAEAIGRTRAELLELRAAQLGVSNQAAPFIARLRDAENGLAHTGMSAAAMSAALRQVPAQVTDIIVSLQGGQAPLTVLLQQGGQLRDMFGSVSGAAKALGGALLNLVNPYTVAIAAAGALVYAYKSGHDESIEYARALAQTGNVAGVTTGQMGDMARNIGLITGSQHEAAAALAELAATGAIAGVNMQRFGMVAVEAQRVLGKSVSDTAAEFAALGKSPLSALDKISEKYHFITADTYAQVKAAQDQGRAIEAASIAQNAYADGISKQRQKVLDSLSDWERGWLRIKTAAGGALDAVIDFASGREKTNVEKINDLLSDRDKIQGDLNRAKARGLAADAAAYQAQLDANAREINAIRDKDAVKRKAAEADATQVRAEELRSKWLGESNVLLTRQQQLQRDLDAARTEGAANGLSEEEIQNRLVVVRRKYNDVYVQGIEASITSLQRRAEIESTRDQGRLAQIEALRSLGSISEDDAINRTASVELDALARQRGVLQDQLGLVRTKINSQREQADLEGQIAVVGEQIRNREMQQKNELLALDQRRYRAAVDATADLIEKDMDELVSLRQQVLAQKDYNDQIGLTEKQVASLTAARLLDAAARKDVEAGIAEGLDLTGERAARIRDEAAAIRERAAALIDGADKSLRYGQWKQAIDQYGQVFQQGFADMLNDGREGWSSFTKSLVTTFKTTVADQIYKMFVRPIIVQLVGSYLGVSSTAIAGEIASQPSAYGATAGGGVSGAISAAQAASSLYKAVTGGFETLSTSVADAVQAGLYKTGLSSNIASNGAVATGAGAIASAGAGILAGRAIGGAISGGYGSNSAVNTGTAAGAIIGSILPGLGTAIGGALGGALGGLYNRAFGYKDKGVTTTGISGTLSSDSTMASSYSKWKQEGGWFRSDKSGTDTTALSADAIAAMTNGLNQLKAVSSSFADSLGVDATSIQNYAKKFDLDLGKDGKIEDGIVKLLTSVGDELATTLVPNIMQFAKTGEAASAVLERLAGDFTATTSVAQLIGKTAAQAFGTVGIESAYARERLVDLAGSASNLTSLASSYAQNFLTEGERLAPVAAAVDEAMSSLGLSWVTTREQFKQVVDSLDLTSQSGAETFTSLMQLSEAFAQVHAASDKLTKTESAIAEERRTLQDQLDQLTMTSAELLAKQRDALDASNQSLFDQVQAAQKVKDAQDAAKTSLGDFIAKMKSFSETAAGLNNSLALGDLSTLTPEQQYIEARKQLEATWQAAAAGDATAQSNVDSLEKTFLQLSNKLNGGDAQYSSDLATVMRKNDELSTWAASSVDVAQASLDALNNSSASLTDISATLTQIAQGVQYLPAVLTGQDTTTYTPTYSIDYSSMGTLDMAPLVAEVKALREEVKGLRAEALTRTGSEIKATEQIANKAAETVVKGTREAVTDAANTIKNSKSAIE